MENKFILFVLLRYFNNPSVILWQHLQPETAAALRLDHRPETMTQPCAHQSISVLKQVLQILVCLDMNK